MCTGRSKTNILKAYKRPSTILNFTKKCVFSKPSKRIDVDFFFMIFSRPGRRRCRCTGIVMCIAQTTIGSDRYCNSWRSPPLLKSINYHHSLIEHSNKEMQNSPIWSGLCFVVFQENEGGTMAPGQTWVCHGFTKWRMIQVSKGLMVKKFYKGKDKYVVREMALEGLYWCGSCVIDRFEG